MVHHEVLILCCTVNRKYYLEVMRRLSKAIREKYIELWKNQSWILHYDNAPVHQSIFVRKVSGKNQRPIILIEKIKEKLKQELLALMKRSFQKCFEGW